MAMAAWPVLISDSVSGVPTRLRHWRVVYKCRCTCCAAVYLVVVTLPCWWSQQLGFLELLVWIVS